MNGVLVKHPASCNTTNGAHILRFILTQWGRGKMDAISQTTFSCAFSSMKIAVFFIKFSMKYVRKGLIDNNPALVPIMAWRRSGDKPLSEPTMISLTTHICVTRPQWVNIYIYIYIYIYICIHIFREWMGIQRIFYCKITSLAPEQLWDCNITKYG